MKFVTYNIQYGLGADGRYDLDRIAAAARPAFPPNPPMVPRIG